VLYFVFLQPLYWRTIFLFSRTTFYQQAIFSRFIVPRNVDLEAEGLERRYSVRFEVAPSSEFVGKPIIASGICKLKGCLVVGLQRDNRLYSFQRQEDATTKDSSKGGEESRALGQEEMLWARDQLHFNAVVEAIVELRNTDGFTLLNESEVSQLGHHRINRSLVEVLFHLLPTCVVALCFAAFGLVLLSGLVLYDVLSCLVLCVVFCCVVLLLFWSCSALCRFVLCNLGLAWHVLFCLVLSNLILSCLVLSCLVLCGVVPYLVLSRLVCFSCLVLSCIGSVCLALSCLVLCGVVRCLALCGVVLLPCCAVFVFGLTCGHIITEAPFIVYLPLTPYNMAS
jgi:hypothetical protein